MRNNKDNINGFFGSTKMGFKGFFFISIGIFVFIGFILFGRGKTNKNSGAIEDPYQLEVVYPRYLDYPKPSSGMVALTNPPALKWPVEKGENIRYEARLSSDSILSNPEKILELKDSPWAIFNPHQKLGTGTWYWQFRKSGGEWSEIQHFRVADSVRSIVSPTAEQFLHALPLSHPRVLVTQADLAQIRHLDPNNDIRAILLNAEKALKTSIPEEREGQPLKKGKGEEQNKKLRLDASKELGTQVYESILALSEGYILSGKEEYAEKAIQIAFEVASWEPRGVSSINDFGDARCMLSMALVFDTFYDRLSETQKAGLLQSIKPRAAHFYSNWINNIEARVLSGHVWQHILHYFFQTGIAVYGAEPDATKWLAYAYELFLAKAPVLGGMDGGWAEGVSYFRMNMETMIDIPLYIKKFTGFDFINAHPWYENQVDWMIYHIPPGSASDGFADNSEEMDMPGTEYVAFALELAKLTNNSKASWYAKKCLEYEKADLSGHATLRWIRLTKTRDLPIPDPKPSLDLPTGRPFHDIGVVSMHSDISNTKENLMVAMRSSPFGSYGHMLSDQNVFNVLYGGKKLFYRTGYKVSMSDPHRTGWYQHTKSQNGILVNGMGQPYSTEAFGWIARFLHTDELAYAKGDASMAYKSKETGEDYSVLKNYRHLILLKPNLLLVYDELEAGNPVAWSWLIHSLDEMKINRENQTFSVQQENALGAGRIWASEKLLLHLQDTFDIDAVNWRGTLGEDGKLKSYENNQYHLKASTSKKSLKMRFFTIIQVGEDLNDTELSEGWSENGKVEIKIGNWTISANLDLETAPDLFVQNHVSETVFSSHGKMLRLQNQSYAGNYPGSSRLGVIDESGFPLFKEAKDQVPYEMQARMQYVQNNNR
ncbi:protein of unknown function [Cyclobacterium lianum]|uniref:Uncharacterized protein n=1 Tax=Cyclobacterium lianum TaxID=388280 RepID=A0A1M7QMD9_9BACT|nr:DUF4962 domain-containing protein [Cyclobacterium lianum]SHN32609.1 protein of unknown function [Cyclobacterium lianum]